MLLDSWWVDKMMQAGGVVAFDCRIPAVEKLICCMLSHRRYAEIETELAVNQGRYLEGWRTGNQAGIFCRLLGQ